MPLPGTIDVVRENQAWVIVLRGEHDLSTTTELKRTILPTRALGVSVVVDLSEIEFMDSTVLAVLVHAAEDAASHQRAFAVIASPRPTPTRLLAVTGIAGPDGGTPQKPVGTVFFGVAVSGNVTSRRFRFLGDRVAIKWQSAQTALDLLRRSLGGVRP